MGTTTIAYGVGLGKLAPAIGSRDAALLAELEKLVRPDPFDEPGRPSVRDGLRALIEGKIEEEPGYQSAMQLYALELLCQHFGRQLDGSEHIGYVDDLGWETALLEYVPPLGLSPSCDFPSVAHLTAEQVRDEYARLSELDVSHDEAWVEEGREELVGWLQQCADDGLALVTFQY